MESAISTTMRYKAERMLPLVKLEQVLPDKIRFRVGGKDKLTEGHRVWCNKVWTDWHCCCRYNALYPDRLCSHALACAIFLEKERLK